MVAPRRHYRALISLLESFTQGDVDRRERLQKLSLIDQGVTFTVYGEREGVEVITERARGRAQAAFQEEVVTIDPPVFTEVPQQRAERPPTAEETAAEAQEQQQ
jgi:hypothetical protein